MVGQESLHSFKRIARDVGKSNKLQVSYFKYVIFFSRKC